MSEDEKTTKRFVCIGLRMYKGGKVKAAFQALGEDDKILDDGSSSAWDKVTGDPGIIYEALVSGEDGSTLHRRAGQWMQVVGQWPDRAQVSEWRALSRTFQAEAHKAKQRAKISANARAEAELSGLRAAYQGTGWAMRSAFLAAVIEEITRR